MGRPVASDLTTLIALCSFLKEEWKFLKEGEAQLNLPIADIVWENLPRRIDERTIEVNLCYSIACKMVSFLLGLNFC